MIPHTIIISTYENGYTILCYGPEVGSLPIRKIVAKNFGELIASLSAMDPMLVHKQFELEDPEADISKKIAELFKENGREWVDPGPDPEAH